MNILVTGATGLIGTALVARAVIGEMGRSVLPSSGRVCPARLLEGEFSLRSPDLDVAFGHLLATDSRHRVD